MRFIKRGTIGSNTLATVQDAAIVPQHDIAAAPFVLEDKLWPRDMRSQLVKHLSALGRRHSSIPVGLERVEIEPFPSADRLCEDHRMRHVRCFRPDVLHVVVPGDVDIENVIGVRTRLPSSLALIASGSAS